jgi:hypothetical protein
MMPEAGKQLRENQPILSFKLTGFPFVRHNNELVIKLLGSGLC